MIGTTGSGKTTCILKFLGYKLQKVECQGLTTLSPIEKIKE
jgi:Tfp pilus assembly ATPase PilU